MAHVKENYPTQLEKGNVKFICLGKKATDFIVKQKFEVVAHSEAIFDKLNFATAAEIAEPIMKDFVDGKYDKVDLIYNSFKNAASQEQKVEPFLPFTIEAGEGAKKSDYIFEPTVDKIVDDMIPKSMKIQDLSIAVAEKVVRKQISTTPDQEMLVNDLVKEIKFN